MGARGRGEGGWALPCGAALLGVLGACAPQESSPPTGASPLELRVALERGEPAVGEPLGLVLELALPRGVVPGAPEPAPSSGFETTAVGEWRALPAAPGGAATARYRADWTLLARDVGRQRVPELGVPLHWPGGERERLVLAAFPLEVRSVRSGEDRGVLRDIRPAPAPSVRAGPGWPWTAGALAALALLRAAWLWWRARARAAHPARGRGLDSPEAVARALAAGLELADARACAAALCAALRGYAERRHGFEASALTARELPACVDEPLRALLVPLERERFARSPERARVEGWGREAQRWLARQEGSGA